jgi:hypothetical protein
MPPAAPAALRSFSRGVAATVPWSTPLADAPDAMRVPGASVAFATAKSAAELANDLSHRVSSLR